jgi:hypothetical protein
MKSKAARRLELEELLKIDPTKFSADFQIAMGKIGMRPCDLPPLIDKWLEKEYPECGEE